MLTRGADGWSRGLGERLRPKPYGSSPDRRTRVVQSGPQGARGHVASFGVFQGGTGAPRTSTGRGSGAHGAALTLASC